MSDDELRDALFDAAATPGRAGLYDLLTSQKARIILLFPGWTRVPSEVRADPRRTKWWAEGTIAVAAAAAELGERSLIARLEGRPEDNIVRQWQDAFLASQADASQGDYAKAISRLEQILVDVHGMVGTAIDHLLPKTYGLLGTLYYHAGDHERARSITAEALALCERIGDVEGVEIYTRNLSVMDLS